MDQAHGVAGIDPHSGSTPAMTNSSVPMASIAKNRPANHQAERRGWAVTGRVMRSPPFRCSSIIDEGAHVILNL